MASVICIHFRQLVEHMHAPHNTAHAKILVSALERQVSWGDNYDEVVHDLCN